MSFMPIFCHNANMSTNVAQNLGKNLAFLRKSRGITQSKLSAVSGIPRTTLSYIETGNGNPSLSILISLATALGISIEELLSPPRPVCLLIKERELKRQVRARGQAEVLTLLPDPIPGLQFERLNLHPTTLILGVPHSKGTKEYFTCTLGKIAVSVEGQEYVLYEGDVLAFPGDRKHSYRNLENSESQGISIVVLQVS
jgi:transcriptional regulator with XRE-family HTH domain